MTVLKAWDGTQWIPVAGSAGPAGAAGPPGPTAVSADADNTAVLGTDGLLYVPASASGGGTRGAILYVEVTTGGLSGITDLVPWPALSGTFEAIAGHKYAISACCELSSTVARNGGMLALYDASLFAITQSSVHLGPANTPAGVALWRVISPPAGPYTITSAVGRQSGSTGAISTVQNPYLPACLLVEDITYVALAAMAAMAERSVT